MERLMRMIVVSTNLTAAEVAVVRLSNKELVRGYVQKTFAGTKPGITTTNDKDAFEYDTQSNDLIDKLRAITNQFDEVCEAGKYRNRTMIRYRMRERTLYDSEMEYLLYMVVNNSRNTLEFGILRYRIVG